MRARTFRGVCINDDDKDDRKIENRELVGTNESSLFVDWETVDRFHA